MSPTDPLFWGIVLAALTSSFFGACNYALIDYSRTRLSEWLTAQGRDVSLIELLSRQRDRLIGVTALMRTASNLAILLAMITLFAPPGVPHGWADLLFAFTFAAVLVVVFGVAVPLSWSRYAAEPLLAYAMPVLRVLSAVMRPLMILVHALDPIVRRLLGAPKRDEADESPAERDLLDAVTEGEESGLVDEDQKEMIEAVVELQESSVEQIMTPRTDIEGIPVDSTLEDVKRFVDEAGHSRVPVYDNDLDHIVGILYVKDLIGLLGTGPLTDFDLRALVREALFVPESKPVRELLRQFKELKVHMAMVLDEYGGTAGLVTIEDILEEIVGEIQDEYEPPDEQEPGIDRVSDWAFEVHARVHIDDLNDELPIQLPEDEDYDTIGGFVLKTLGHVPGAGESFEQGGVRVTVTEAERTRVKRVRLELLKGAEAGG